MAPTRTLFERASTTTTTSSASVSCTSAVPDKYGHVPIDACDAYYNFYPSFDGNLAFAVLFGITTIIHLVQAIVYKKKYCWVITMGASWELAAFAIKTIGAHDQQKLAYVIWGTLLFLLAPLWINAFVYMTVARMVYFRIPEKKIWGVRAIRLGTLFIWLDVVCFLVQVGGGSMLSSDNSASTIRLGQKIYMVGIGIQLAFIVLFGGMTCWFYYRLAQLEGHSNLGRIKYLIWTMITVLVLVMVRIIYRLCEFGPGVSEDNPILANENYGFLLDAFPMLLALVLMNAMHPGLVLRGPDSDFPSLSRKEKKALKQQKKQEKAQRKADKKARKQGGSGYEMYDSVVEEETPRPTNGRYETYREHGREEHGRHQRDSGHNSSQELMA
ncbi:RTA1 like protein-domain-containing protein [Thelonectria olida]|uniref:RTA1 like protein-domain-containing protein n=1 Tax=Thelonectria olida TaxID=1576542 RepID=A0A9P8WES4_9HYPO|nr:RTA1 like protein-domain-containing protein [Thelonectria olida]